MNPAVNLDSSANICSADSSGYKEYLVKRILDKYIKFAVKVRSTS
jgi:hypothetical protein